MITINYKDKRPIYEQLVERVEELVAAGHLTAGSQLPSVRQLAYDLSINPNTIQRAYTELERRGITYSMKGRGSFISADSAQLLSSKKRVMMGQFHALTGKMLSSGFTKDELIGAIKEGPAEREAL